MLETHELLKLFSEPSTDWFRKQILAAYCNMPLFFLDSLLCPKISSLRTSHDFQSFSSLKIILMRYYLKSLEVNS